MNFTIAENVLKETTKCNKNFSCLSCDKKCLCKVTHIVGNYDILFIETESTTICPYKIAYGDSHFCACPTRSELTKQMDKMERQTRRNRDVSNTLY